MLMLTHTHNPVSLVTITSYHDREKDAAFTSAKARRCRARPFLEVLHCQGQEEALNLDLAREWTLEATACPGVEVLEWSSWSRKGRCAKNRYISINIHRPWLFSKTLFC